MVTPSLDGEEKSANIFMFEKDYWKDFKKMVCSIIKGKQKATTEYYNSELFNFFVKIVTGKTKNTDFIL